MVTQALSLTGNGLTDFIIQRVTAVILAVYTIYVLMFFMQGDVTHASLVAFFDGTAMQIFSTLAILSTIAHAWIGMWTIGTDYLRPAHIGAANVIRFVYQIGCILVMFIYLIWSLQLIWL